MHPRAMGMRGEDVWAETWPLLIPQIESATRDGKASWNVDHLLPIKRQGRIEDSYFTYSYSPVYLENGSVGGTLVTCTETTTRVLAERALLESEQQVVDVLESMSDAFFSIDKNWIVTRLNAQHEKVTHYKRQDQLGKSLLETNRSGEEEVRGDLRGLTDDNGASSRAKPRLRKYQS